MNLKFDNTGNELIHFSLVKNDQEDLKWSHQFDEIKCPNFIKYLRDLAQYAVHSFRSSYSSDLYRNGFVIGKKGADIEKIKKHYGFSSTPKQHPNDTQMTPKQHPNDTFC